MTLSLIYYHARLTHRENRTDAETITTGSELAVELHCTALCVLHRCRPVQKQWIWDMRKHLWGWWLTQVVRQAQHQLHRLPQ